MKKQLTLKLSKSSNESLYDELEALSRENSNVEEAEITMEGIEADNLARFKKAVEAYKKYAAVECKEDLLEENLFRNPLNRVSREYAIGTDTLRDLLKEEASKMDDADKVPETVIATKIKKEDPEVTSKQAEYAAGEVKDVADNLDSDLGVIYIEGDIEKSLTSSLNAAMRSHNKWTKRKEIDKSGYSNVCIVGDVGTGKTERVKAWAKQNKIELVAFKANSLTIDDIKAIPIGEDPENKGRAKTVSFGTFDIFDRDKLCVLYLDEFNRAAPHKKDTWFKFIDEHAIYDATDKETGMKFFPNLLFTVATINPYVLSDGSTDDEEGVYPLSKAESDRFGDYIELSNQGKDYNKYTAAYFTELYKKDTEKYPEYAKQNAGKLSIALKLLDNPNFFFNDNATISRYHQEGKRFLTSRGLTNLLSKCDGTIENFLYFAPGAVGVENAKMLATFLKGYSNIADKPNEVWSFWDKLGVKTPKEEEKKEPEAAEEKEVGTLKKRVSMYDRLNDLQNK